jgi:anion-transporting  ArsA/GET3 family ATPase
MAPAKAGGKAYLKVVSVGFNVVTSVVTKVLGAQLLKDVSAFIAALDTMFGGFRERADQTYKLLKNPETRFLVIAAPERDALREASYFVERLSAENMPLAGLVLNRVHRSAASALSAERALAAAEDLDTAKEADAALSAALLRLHADRMQVIAREEGFTESFSSAHPAVRVTEVGAQAADVHDLDGLRVIGTELAGHL